MKTVLRIVSRDREGGYFDIPNPYNMIPIRGDHFVYKQESYIVSLIEVDYDTDTVYIVSAS